MLHETTLNLIGLLVEQGVIKQEVADAMMRKAEEKAAKKVATQRTLEKKAEAEVAAKEKNVVRVGYVPEHVKREMRDQIRQEVVAQARQERWGDVKGKRTPAMETASQANPHTSITPCRLAAN